MITAQTATAPLEAASAAPPAQQALATAEPISRAEAVTASANLKEVVAEKSNTAGSIVDTLDALAWSLGDTRISLWDILVLMVIVGAVIIGAWLFSKLAHKLLGRFTKLDSTQRLLGEKLLSIAVWAMAFFVGIDILGIDLTAFAVFSGAFGLAIGFGLQKTFGNLIAGIILLMDRSIKPGDVISVSDQAGKESFGQIRKIGIRAISVVTRDRTEYLIPNENLMINQVVNWSYSSRDVRVKVPVGVAFGMDMDLVEKLLLQAARETPRILANPEPRAFMVGIGESTVNFEIRFWIDDPEEGMGNVRSDVFKRIWALFHEHRIEMAYPQRDINLRANEQFEQLIAAISQRFEDRK